MNTELQKIALRYNALYLPGAVADTMTPEAAAFAESLRNYGYTLSEDALHAVDALSESDIKDIVAAINDVWRTELNWSSLIKSWLRPTGETWFDHQLGYLVNAFPKGMVDGCELPCGHIIPSGLFDLERYNGCPICGTPFTFKPGVNFGGSEPSKVLGRMTDEDMKALMLRIMASPLPPSATDADSLKTLVGAYSIPEAPQIGNTETRIMLSAALFAAGNTGAALALIPDAPLLMRMLWYINTGSLRIIKKFDSRTRLHYTRTQCKAIACWFDKSVGDIAAACEAMNPAREMWVRFIRALRLPEYARRLKLTRLQELLDRFYRKDYTTWAGDVEAAKLSHDIAHELSLLAERPGAFARRLFSTMLTAGAESTLAAFKTIAPGLPPRLMCTLAGAATLWFEAREPRSVALPDGRRVSVPANPAAKELPAERREECIAAIKDMANSYFTSLYKSKGQLGERFYLAPELMEIPVPIGDRGISVNDSDIALQGQIFHVKGEQVRLFMQWGAGLPAQHLDMDLSAKIIYDGSATDCAYYNLYPAGATHSGDIQHIPDMTGTAEYIELDLPKLAETKARYVVFACNAYSSEELSPNLCVGWMNSGSPMKVDDATGVAYDPSTVQHMVHISASTARGLVFGILDVRTREITWLEMPNSTQRLEQLDIKGVEALLAKLRSKVSIGELLKIYAEARGCTISDDSADADRIFDLAWAADSSAVAALLF